MKAKQIVLASRPVGLPKESDFRYEDITLPALKEGEVLLDPNYISVDPYMRGRMSSAKSYVDPFELDQPISGGVVATVLESKSDKFKKGDQVQARLPWATKIIASADELTKNIPGIPPSYFLGIVGMPGLTGYFGTTDICKPTKGETFVVSGAAGAVGTVVGQIGKLKGAKVIGIAGTQDKVDLLLNEFGFDAVINYKTENVAEKLDEYCPDGIDCYYENVGGEITDAVMDRLNRFARIAVCGQIALYNNTEVAMGPRILPTILKTSALVKGFIVSDYMDRMEEGATQLATWVQEGKLKYKETFINGFENIPEAFIGLFKGTNTGKMIVKV